MTEQPTEHPLHAAAMNPEVLLLVVRSGQVIVVRAPERSAVALTFMAHARSGRLPGVVVVDQPRDVRRGRGGGVYVLMGDPAGAGGRVVYKLTELTPSGDAYLTVRVA